MMDSWHIYIKRIVLTCFLFLLFSHTNKAQNFFFSIQPLKNTAPQTEKFFSLDSTFIDSTAASNYLKIFIDSLHSMGYLEASADSIAQRNDSLFILLHIGNKYTITELKANLHEVPNIQNWLADSSAMSDFNYLHILTTYILDYYQNNGYPYTTIKKEWDFENQNKVKIELIIEKNEAVFLDSINNSGDLYVDQSYLKAVLDLNKRKPFNLSELSMIEKKLEQIKFINIIEKPRIELIGNRGIIQTSLNKTKSNHFNGVVGILPGNEYNEKMQLTGLLEFQMINAFYHGDVITLKWNSYEKYSQKLELQFEYPYIGGSDFGIKLQHMLRKQDSSFLTRRSHIAIQYHYFVNQSFGVFYRNKASNIFLSSEQSDSMKIRDFKIHSFGLQVDVNRRNKMGTGLHVAVSAAKGRKQMNFPGTDYMQANSDRDFYELGTQIIYQIPIFNSHHFYIENKYEQNINNSIVENELYRIGGFNSLKGFDEESIWASIYNITDLQYRYFFEKNSYLAIFYNFGYYENNSLSQMVHDWPWGFGSGISIQTKAGQYSLFYGLGKQLNQPIDFRSGKIHFGLEAAF